MPLSNVISIRVVAACALLLALTALVSASAEASALGEGEDPHPDPRVAQLVTDYAIPIEEAERRIAGQRTIAETSATLGREFPTTFGGVWVDHYNAGRIVVQAVGLDAELITRASELLGKWATDLHPADVEYNLTELREVHRTLLHFRDHLQSLGPGNIGTRLDIPNNDIAVFIGENGQFWHPDLAPLMEELGSRARVVEEDLISVLDCNARKCDPPLRGGTGIDLSPETPGPWCTSGFIARPKGGGQDHIITAGHCANEYPYWYADTTSAKLGVGPTMSATEGGMSDVASILVAPATPGLNGAPPTMGPAFWDPRPVIYHNRTEPYVHVYGKTTSPDEAVPGTLICRTGFKTGIQCGEIVSNATQPSFGEKFLAFINYPFTTVYTGLLEADFCASGGDSGGPWYDWYYAESGWVGDAAATAYGIHHGSQLDDPDGNTCPDENSYATHIAIAEAHTGLEVICNIRCNAYD